MGMNREPAPDHLQPREFSFTRENLEEAKMHIAKYPEGRQQSAVMPLLMLAQRQHDGWLPRAAIEYVANMLHMPVIRAFEVASFYTMYNLAPVGRYHVQVCGTTPCMLCGSDEVMRACVDTLGIKPGQNSEDGQFTLTEVECLGSCVTAPMLQVSTPEWDHYFEDLNYERTVALLKQLRRGEMPKVGPQSGRLSSEPAGGPTTLADQREAYEKLKKVS